MRVRLPSSSVVAQDSPNGLPVPAQPKPPAVTDVVRAVTVEGPLTKASAPVATPMVLPTGLSPQDLLERLRKMKDYRNWAVAENLPRQNILDEATLKAWLSRSGYDPKLSRHVFPALAS